MKGRHMRIRSTLAALAVTGTTVLAPTAQATVPTCHPSTCSIAVSQHMVVEVSNLPHCAEEDASSGPLPCTWNIGPGEDGNGVGLAYFVDGRGHTHYVWSTNPTVRPSDPDALGWKWIPAHIRANFRAHHPHRFWFACVIREDGAVKCPDGTRWTTT